MSGAMVLMVFEESSGQMDASSSGIKFVIEDDSTRLWAGIFSTSSSLASVAIPIAAFIILQMKKHHRPFISINFG